VSCNNDKKGISTASNEGALVISTSNFDETVKTDPTLSTEIIKLESSTKEQLIGQIDKLICKNNKFYILDRTIAKAVYVFDEDGKFEFRIKRRGLGPGEYNECWDIDVDNEGNIYILGVNMYKVIKYDKNGKYLKEASYGFQTFNFCNVAADTFALYQMNRFHDSKELNYNIIYWTTDGLIPFRYFPYSHEQNRGFTIRPSYFQRNESSILFSSIYCDTIFEVSTEGLSAKYIFKPKDSEYYKKSYQIQDHKERSQYLYKSDVPWNFHNYLENDEQFISSFFYKSNVGVLIFNKKNSETKYFIFSDIKDQKTIGFKPYALHNGKLVGHVLPSHLKNIKNAHFVKQLNLPESFFENDSLRMGNPYLIEYTILD